MQLRLFALTIIGFVVGVGLAFVVPHVAFLPHSLPSVSSVGIRPAEIPKPLGQSFDDVGAVAQHFADELGRLKEASQTVSPVVLGSQADAENNFAASPLPDPGRKQDAAAIYRNAKSGVVVVGGIYKCDKCRHWHVQCASGFVLRADGLIVVNFHTVDKYRNLAAFGIMTDDGRVFPVKAVLAASRLNDLALLKIDAVDLHPLPLSSEIATGETVFCLSHPVLPDAAASGFFTFSQGFVSGQFAIRNNQGQLVRVLGVTAEYGPGSSGGPLLNDHGAVIGVACQAISLPQKAPEKNVQMIWRFGRPSCSILAMLQTTTSKPAAKQSELAAVSKPFASKTPHYASRGEQHSTDANRSTFTLQPCDLRGVTYYRPVPVTLSRTPPIKPKAEPAYRSHTPLYGVLRLGDAEENHFLVALDEPTSGESKIYIDRDGSGDLTRGPGNWERERGGVCSIGNVTMDVPYTSGKAPQKYTFFRNKTRASDRLFYYRSSGREGEIVLDGKRYRVLVLDDNSDGRFDDLRNGAIVIDINQDGKLDASQDSAEFFRLDEPFNINGNVWEVASLSPDGLQLTIRRSSADVPVKPYLDIGYPAPEFAGRGLNDETIDLKNEAAKSRYVLLDFWASWCGPCRGEFPTLRRVNARYKNHGLTVIGVNLDSQRSQAIDAAKQALLLYPHVFDGRGWQNAVATLYRVHGIPQIYLLDNQLNIVGKNLRGPLLEKRLEELLGPGDEQAAKAVDRAAPPQKPTQRPNSRP